MIGLTQAEVDSTMKEELLEAFEHHCARIAEQLPRLQTLHSRLIGVKTRKIQFPAPLEIGEHEQDDARSVFSESGSTASSVSSATSGGSTTSSKQSR